MADPIIKELNNRLAQTISTVKPAGSPSEGGGGVVSKFDQVLTSKRDNSAMEKLAEVILDDKKSDKMQVLSAENIQINVSNSELGQTSNFEGKKAVQDLFAMLNNDALKMDSIVEVLASSETKLTQQQLLAYQSTVSTLSLNMELSSKLAQSLSQNINTLLQTNMG